MSAALDNPFWHFSLQFYDEPRVQTLCLQLQDQWGQDVNLLLYACWLGSQGRRLHCDTPLLQEVQRWQQEVVGNLRALRRSLDKRNPQQRPLRDAVQDAELKAECYEQWLLFDQLQQLSTAVDDADSASLIRRNLLDAAGVGNQSDKQMLLCLQELATLTPLQPASAEAEY